MTAQTGMSRPTRGGRLLWIGGLLPAALLVGCAPTSFVVTPIPANQELEERVVVRESPWTQWKIALIDVDGVLRNSRPTSLLGTSGENPVALFTEKLSRAAEDKRVRAIVVRINSPGGTVTASDLMHQALKHFRAQTGKPVIAAMLDVAASGGYYLACAADETYAQPTTVTGSIGVIMILPEFAGTMQKLGLHVNVIKSGEMKDAGSMFRAMAPQDRAMFAGLIDGMYQRFLGVVAAARPELAQEQVQALADGRVFLGPEAHALGLVDAVGTLQDALEAAKRAAGLAGEPVKVVRYERPVAYRPNIYAQTDLPPAQVNLVNVAWPDWLSDPAPQMLYLWAPTW